MQSNNKALPSQPNFKTLATLGNRAFVVSVPKTVPGTVYLLNLEIWANMLTLFKTLLKMYIFCMQGVTLALACLPRQVSKVSGERKSSITRPFGEYNFNCQEII